MQRKVKELVNESSSSLLKQRFKLLFKDFLGQWGSLSSSSNWTKSSRACSQTSCQKSLGKATWISHDVFSNAMPMHFELTVFENNSKCCIWIFVIFHQFLSNFKSGLSGNTVRQVASVCQNSPNWKRSSLRSQCCMWLFLWFSNTVKWQESNKKQKITSWLLTQVAYVKTRQRNSWHKGPFCSQKDLSNANQTFTFSYMLHCYARKRKWIVL